jgi:hypothetical protein
MLPTSDVSEWYKPHLTPSSITHTHVIPNKGHRKLKLLDVPISEKSTISHNTKPSPPSPIKSSVDRSSSLAAKESHLRSIKYEKGTDFSAFIESNKTKPSPRSKDEESFSKDVKKDNSFLREAIKEPFLYTLKDKEGNVSLFVKPAVDQTRATLASNEIVGDSRHMYASAAVKGETLLTEILHTVGGHSSQNIDATNASFTILEEFAMVCKPWSKILLQIIRILKGSYLFPSTLIAL